ncbi:IclR family transcriptional regulator [Gulosibacter faecalis]|uniref:IclR family transcriptional regulator n=1 Tax=Gulosibacter faecalis TaxID=272240 RepID=A0ABW5UW05_9MICO|nr:helix-turn-helix domain-containing protein [Gulosibacter faecalis]
MAEPALNRSLVRAAAILDAVEDAPRTASEIARRIEVSVSATHRLATDMVELGFLRRTPEGKYLLGRRFNKATIGEAARPLLTKLRDETGETLQLWVRQGSYRVCVTSVESRHELRATLPELSRLRLPDGSAGAILGASAEGQKSLKAHGWVESIGARTPGLSSVSAPVYVEGEVLGALCLALPIARLESTPGEQFGDALIECAAELSRVFDRDEVDR